MTKCDLKIILQIVSQKETKLHLINHERKLKEWQISILKMSCNDITEKIKAAFKKIIRADWKNDKFLPETYPATASEKVRKLRSSKSSD